MPGGVLATYVMPDEEAFVVSAGKGCRVFNRAGREYIDWVLGSGPMILGHAHPAVVAALHDQITKGTQFYSMTQEAFDLANIMVDAIPCADMVKLTSTGSEATFYALRLARSQTGRDKVLRFEGAYHGHNDYAAVGVSAGIPDVLQSLVVTTPFNQTDIAVEVIRRHAPELAAVIVEPLQRVIPPVPGFLEALRSVTAELGIVLIFDELVTGFRLAWGGAQERYGVIPDLATYGKIIGGGLPMAAVAGRAPLMELANPRHRGNQYVYFSGTLNGNPLGAVAGTATLGVLKGDHVYEDLQQTSDRLRRGLVAIASRVNRPMQVVGDGPVVGLIFADGDVSNYATMLASDRAVANRLDSELFRRGHFVNVGAKFYISVAHGPKEVDDLLNAVEDSLSAIVARSSPISQS